MDSNSVPKQMAKGSSSDWKKGNAGPFNEKVGFGKDNSVAQVPEAMKPLPRNKMVTT